MKSQPIIFEVYGHYQQHAITRAPAPRVSESSDTSAPGGGLTRPPPRRLLPPAIPISAPMRSSKFR